MKKITLLMLCFFIGGLMTMNAQYSFPAIPGPTNVANGTPVTLNINDVANGAGATAGTYDTFTVTADWVAGGGGPYSSEADLTMTTTAGSVLIDPPTDSSASSNPYTLVFQGTFAANYDPSVDGFLDITLNQSWSGSDADWSNIVVTINPAPNCTVPVATTSVVDDCQNSQFSIEVDITDLGDASSLTISNDAGVDATTGINAIGIVTVGPFSSDSIVTLTLEHEQDSVCNVDLGSSASACPPSNDTCGGAIDVACDQTVTGDTSNPLATDTVGNASADLWYSYSGPAGDITASLCESSYDTNVRVYDSCGGTEIAANDDSCGTRSEVTFTADGSSTYYIAVEGWNSSEGIFEMTVTCLETIPPPANDAFADAEALATGVATSGTTAGATENLADEKPSCDPFGNIADVWYTYTQPANTDTMIITTSISGTSSEANCAVYSVGEPILAENQVACGDDGQASGEMLEFAATPGTTYYIRVWSDGALPPVSGRVEGTFNVTADAALSTDEFDNPAVFTYYPNPVKNTLTLNAQNNIEDVRVYNMLGQEVINVKPQTLDSELDISSLETGTYFVQVTIANITKTVRVIKQ